MTSPQISNSIRRTLKEYIVQKGISMHWLSKQIGKSKACVTRYLAKKEYGIKIENLIRICNVLQISFCLEYDSRMDLVSFKIIEKEE